MMKLILSKIYIVLGAISVIIGATLTVAVTIAMLLGFTGCSTASLRPNSTPEQVNAALCKDAQTGLIMAQVVLTTRQDVDAAQRMYWEAWLRGAQEGVLMYCMKP